MIEFGLNRKDIATLEREAWDAASSLRGECNERLLCQIENYMMALEDNAEDAENKMKDLESELAQARAAAVQWVDFECDPPEPGRLIIVNTGEFNGEQYYFAINSPEDMPRDYLRNHLQHKSAKRWAYLPTPPEVES